MERGTWRISETTAAWIHREEEKILWKGCKVLRIWDLAIVWGAGLVAETASRASSESRHFGGVYARGSPFVEIITLPLVGCAVNDCG